MLCLLKDKTSYMCWEFPIICVYRALYSEVLKVPPLFLRAKGQVFRRQSDLRWAIQKAAEAWDENALAQLLGSFLRKENSVLAFASAMVPTWVLPPSPPVYTTSFLWGDPHFAPNDRCPLWFLKVFIVCGDPSHLLEVTLHMHLSLQQGLQSLGGRDMTRVPLSLMGQSALPTAREPSWSSASSLILQGDSDPDHRGDNPCCLPPCQPEDEACKIFSPFLFHCVIHSQSWHFTVLQLIHWSHRQCKASWLVTKEPQEATAQPGSVF